MKPEQNNLNFGLIIEEKKRDTDYQLGAVEKIVLEPDGQWTEYSPECEIQKTDYDDLMDCVTESQKNWEKIMLERKFGIKSNRSQRYTAKMSGTTKYGNSLFNVANSVRKDGSVEEADWPRHRGMGWAQYYSSIPGSVKDKGAKFVNQFDVNYEYVPTTKAAIKEALKYGPVQAIGYAWAHEDGIYKDYGYKPNHAFLIVGYVENRYWIIYDSYPTDFIIDENSEKQEFIKHLDWNYKFGDALLYSIKLKPTDNKSWIYKIINMLRNFYRDIKSGKFYFVKKVNNAVMKQEINSVNGVLTLLDVNFGAKQAEWGELVNYKDYKFFS